jgi:hypothetical protein
MHCRSVVRLGESELADELLTSDIPGVADVRFNLTAVIQLWGGERST